jgi:RecB family endonuclease NucS
LLLLSDCWWLLQLSELAAHVIAVERANASDSAVPQLERIWKEFVCDRVLMRGVMVVWQVCGRLTLVRDSGELSSNASTCFRWRGMRVARVNVQPIQPMDS